MSLPSQTSGTGSATEVVSIPSPEMPQTSVQVKGSDDIEMAVV
jgi:hypothetical protein